MEKRLIDTGDIKDVSFTNNECIDRTPEIISIESDMEIDDRESQLLEINKCNKYVSASPENKKSFSSIILLDGSMENVSNIQVKPCKYSTLTARKKQGCYKNSYNVNSKTKKTISNYSIENEDQPLYISKINKKKGWTIFPANSKSNIVIKAENRLSTKNIENISGDGESDDETLTELPKKIFSLISESIVKCTLCFKQMKLSSMRQHYRTHTGVKPFKCQFCAHRFTRNADLHRHISSLHPQRRPLNFQCLICTKYFIDKKTLISHLKSHNRALYLVCHICGHKFKDKTYFQNHIKFVHSLSTNVSNSYTHKQALKQIKALQAQDSEKKFEVTKSQQQNDKCDQSLEEFSDEDGLNLEIKIKNEPYEYMSDNCSSELEEEEEEEECPLATASNISVSDSSSQSVSNCKMMLTSPKTAIPNLDHHNGKKSEVFEEEQLIAKAINEHVIQAENTLENIRLSLSQEEDHTTLKEVELKQHKEIDENTSVQNKLISIPKSSEIHISASVDNKIQKFILRVPSGRLIDATTQKGMDVLVNLIKDLYAGKGELNGNIDVTLHHNIT